VSAPRAMNRLPGPYAAMTRLLADHFGAKTYDPSRTLSGRAWAPARVARRVTVPSPMRQRSFLGAGLSALLADWERFATPAMRRRLQASQRARQPRTAPAA
jgi:hypothetical protein